MACNCVQVKSNCVGNTDIAHLIEVFNFSWVYVPFYLLINTPFKALEFTWTYHQDHPQQIHALESSYTFHMILLEPGSYWTSGVHLQPPEYII